MTVMAITIAAMIEATMILIKPTIPRTTVIIISVTTKKSAAKPTKKSSRIC